MKKKNEEELKPFIESISTKSWARILKIVRDAIGEERTQDKRSSTCFTKRVNASILD
jgi:hypothetical protein